FGPPRRLSRAPPRPGPRGRASFASARDLAFACAGSARWPRDPARHSMAPMPGTVGAGSEPARARLWPLVLGAVLPALLPRAAILFAPRVDLFGEPVHGLP